MAKKEASETYNFSAVAFEDVNLVELSPEDYAFLCGEQNRVFVGGTQHKINVEEQAKILEQIQLQHTLSLISQNEIMEQASEQSVEKEQEKILEEIRQRNANEVMSQIHSGQAAGSQSQLEILERYQIAYALEAENQQKILDDIHSQHGPKPVLCQTLDQIQEPWTLSKTLFSPAKNGLHGPIPNNDIPSEKILKPCAAILNTGHLVPLHGPEVTRLAISKGMAIQIQCPQCLKLMNIKHDATLMFCPACSSISPVIVPRTHAECKVIQETIPAITSDAETKHSKKIAPAHEEKKKSCCERCTDAFIDLLRTFIGV